MRASMRWEPSYSPGLGLGIGPFQGVSAAAKAFRLTDLALRRYLAPRASRRLA